MKAKLMAVCLTFLICLSGCGQIQQELTNMDNRAAVSDLMPAPATNIAVTETTAVPANAVPDDEPISSGYIISGSSEYVELYSQTDTASSALARLYTGDFVAILALQGQWYQVKYADLTGYVPVDVISFSKPSAEAAAPQPAQTQAQPVQTQAPQTQAPVQQQPVNVTINLQYDGYGIALPRSYPTYIAYDSTRNAYCSASSCYIYKTASTSGPRRNADMLYKGDAVTVYGEYNGFYYIGTDSGSGYDLMGYVKAGCITIGTPPQAADKSYSAEEGYVDVNSCKVRSSPSKENESNVIDTLYYGQYFTINSFDGYWYYISYEKNGYRSGYISYKMVKVY